MRVPEFRIKVMPAQSEILENGSTLMVSLVTPGYKNWRARQPLVSIKL